MDFTTQFPELLDEDLDPQHMVSMGALKVFIDRMYAVDPLALRRFLAGGRRHVLRTLRKTFGDFCMTVKNQEIRLRDEDYDYWYVQLCLIARNRPAPVTVQ